jgi:hypothetical protein
MKGIYLEFDLYDIADLTQDELKALKALGVGYKLDYGLRKIRILHDTSTLNHEKCELRE